MIESCVHQYPFQLGNYSRIISTSSPAAQQWFDLGLLWCYGYNHEESIACFQNALAEDSDCAMALWGIAYASGCNYNKPWCSFEQGELLASIKQARDAVTSAQLKSTSSLQHSISHCVIGPSHLVLDSS